MYIYVAHKYNGDTANYERAEKIMHNLQIFDRDNTYFCPQIAFSYIKHDELSDSEWLEMYKDMMCVCDKVLVASDGVDGEIEFAKKIHMEVEYLEKS